MKKAIMLIVFMLMTGVTQLLSQPGPGNRLGLAAPGVQQLIIQYEDELNLTDDQKEQLIELQIEHRNQFRQFDRPMRRGDRGNFRSGRRGSQGQGLRNPGQGFWGSNFEARMEMRQEVLDILTDEQIELLQNEMIQKADKASEFRTFRHEYIVNEAGIEGDKAEQVLNLLNAQSANRLELAKQRILNTEEVNQDLWANHFQQMRETDDELRNILTVDEYENLRQNLGFGFGNRQQGKFGRGYRMWNR